MATNFNYGMPLQSASSNTMSGDKVVSGGLLNPTMNVTGIDGRTGAQAEADMRMYGHDIFNDILYHKTEEHPTLALIGPGSEKATDTDVPFSETYEDENYMDNQFEILRTRVTPHSENFNYYYNTARAYGATPNVNQIQANGTPNRINHSSMANSGALRWSKVIDEQTATTGALVNLALACDLSTADAVPDVTKELLAITSSDEATSTAALTAGTKRFKSKHCVALGWSKLGGQIIGGSAAVGIEEVRANMIGCGFAFAKAVKFGATQWLGVTRTANSAPFKFMFDNLAFTKTDAGNANPRDYQLSGVVVEIEAFFWSADDEQFVYVLNMDEINSDVEPVSAATAGEIYHFQLKEFSNGTTQLQGLARVLPGVTYVSPTFLMGGLVDFVEGIPEGGMPTLGHTFKRNFAAKSNTTQIFQMPAWTLTGTRAACKTSRFIDDWTDTRKRKLKMHKDNITSQMIWGVKSKSSKLNPFTNRYEEVRTMGGLLDKQLWKIRYMKHSMPDFAYTSGATAADAARALTMWAEKIVKTHMAFRSHKRDGNVTMVCSPDLIANLREVAAYAQSFGPNMFGAVSVGSTQKGSMELGFDVTTFKTAYGTLNFIEEPALAYMTKFPLPYDVSQGVPVSPRKIAFMLDLPSIKMMTLRPDVLRGNLQAPGQDVKLMEDILGEHSLKVMKAAYQTMVIFE